MGEVDHHEYTVAETTDILARSAASVVAAGTCSSYGGVPAARGRWSASVKAAILKMRGIPTPVINVPGCPPHPDWMVGTLALLLDAMKRKGTEGGVLEIMRGLDDVGRPRGVFIGEHTLTCPYTRFFRRRVTFATDRRGAGSNSAAGGRGAAATPPRGSGTAGSTGASPTPPAWAARRPIFPTACPPSMKTDRPEAA